MGKAALLIVDVQNDFLPPNGSLAVPNGRDIIPVIQKLLKPSWNWQSIVAAQDYHPKDHISFATTHSVEPFTEKQVKDARGNEYAQTMWPDHCVQGTSGTEIESELKRSLLEAKNPLFVARKGWHSGIEAYSTFEGYLSSFTTPAEPPSAIPERVPSEHTELARHLKKEGVDRVVITGLATDYCILSTAKSALEAGLITFLPLASVRGIDEKGVQSALEQIRGMGGKTLEGDDWEEQLEKLIRA